MVRKQNKRSGGERLVEFDASFLKYVPHLRAFFSNEESFIDIRLKARDDGTILVIAKEYSSDGTPMVCFGVGYGVVAALLAIDATMNGGRWKIDKPWQPKGS